MTIQSFQTLVTELGALIGVPDLAADDTGYIALSFEGVTLFLQHDAEAEEVVAFARIGTVDGDRVEQTYGMLLGANLFWQGTRGSTIGVDPVNGATFLMGRHALASLRSDSFAAWLEQIQEMAVYWTARIAAAEDGAVNDDEATASDLGPDRGPVDTAVFQPFGAMVRG